MSRHQIDTEERPPVRLILAIGCLLLLGTVGAVFLRPVAPDVTLQRAAEGWPPAPYVQPAEE